MTTTNLAARLTEQVAKRLAVPVSFERWDIHKPTGASIPVFRVPQTHVAAAKSLGLTVVGART